MSKINKLLKKLGPGLLFAGAAIGVSHLVQSTRAGADFGMGLLWALILVNIFKYPFFQYGPRYATATGESLLDGYYKLGKGILIAYAIITLATMFTIQTAVTIVTAGLATSLTNGIFSTEIWTIIIIAICLFECFYLFIWVKPGDSAKPGLGWAAGLGCWMGCSLCELLVSSW